MLYRAHTPEPPLPIPLEPPPMEPPQGPDMPPVGDLPPIPGEAPRAD